jgi:hypothetical protein
MTLLFIAAIVAVVLILGWCYVCLNRISRGHHVRHPERTLWFPGVFATVALLGVLSLVQEWDEDARLALEREVVNGCPRPAPGLSDTIALLVNAPAGVAPRVDGCIRHQARDYVIREQRQARKDKIAEAR